MRTASEYRRLLTKYALQPIRSQAAYEQAIVQLEKLMVPRPNAAHSLLIEMLATLIEKYESRQYPTSEVAQAAMLAKLLATKGVKPADVARTTGIPRNLKQCAGPPPRHQQAERVQARRILWFVANRLSRWSIPEEKGGCQLKYASTHFSGEPASV